eukprot:902938-Prymnesium_polylepis.1
MVGRPGSAEGGESARCGQRSALVSAHLRKWGKRSQFGECLPVHATWIPLAFHFFRRIYHT